MTATHVVNPLGVKLALAPSLTVYVAPGVSPPKVAVPLADMVVPLVEIVAVALTDSGPPVRVKVKLPVPPTVFLVTTIEPKATLLKLQPLDAPGLTVVTQLVGPTALKLALAASLTEERRVGKEGRSRRARVPVPALVAREPDAV